jgi:hypothetical protein
MFAMFTMDFVFCMCVCSRCHSVCTVLFTCEGTIIECLRDREVSSVLLQAGGQGTRGPVENGARASKTTNQAVSTATQQAQRAFRFNTAEDCFHGHQHAPVPRANQLHSDDLSMCIFLYV